MIWKPSYYYNVSSWRNILIKLTLSLPNETVVEFNVHCQTRLQSKFIGTVDRGLFLMVIWDTTLCSLSQNVQGGIII